jgi:hypothetical protein
MHGEGVMTWQNPQVRYVGSWWNGKRYGQGRITFAEDDEAERVHYEGTMQVVLELRFAWCSPLSALSR